MRNKEIISLSLIQLSRSIRYPPHFIFLLLSESIFLLLGAQPLSVCDLASALGGAAKHTSFLEDTAERDQFCFTVLNITSRSFPFCFFFSLPFELYIRITTCVSIQRNTAQHGSVKVQKTIWHYTCSICHLEFSRTLLLQNQISSDTGKDCCSVRNMQVPTLIFFTIWHPFCNLGGFFFLSLFLFHLYFRKTAAGEESLCLRKGTR